MTQNETGEARLNTRTFVDNLTIHSHDVNTLWRRQWIFIRGSSTYDIGIEKDEICRKALFYTTSILQAKDSGGYAGHLPQRVLQAEYLLFPDKLSEEHFKISQTARMREDVLPASH